MYDTVHVFIFLNLLHAVALSKRNDKYCVL